MMLSRLARGSLAAAVAAGAVGGSVAAAPSDRAVSYTFMLGKSVDGRSIIAYERGDQDSPRKVLIVGCIHGNECAGMAVTAHLAAAAPTETDLWIVPDLNP